MASSIGTVFRSFWHTMTSYDRHSDFNSPYRSGSHQPLNQRSGMGVLTSVATASESRADITNPYGDESRGMSSSQLDGTSTAYGGFDATQSHPSSPAIGRPYSPGMRGITAKRTSTVDGFEMQSPAGEIPMQSFQDGMPPAPPIKHTWSRIDNWAEDNYPELYDQLCEGCTTNDINELEHVLDCTLPQDVRESLQIHDGQERGGRPTGIIFSSMLLDCEEIVQEWDNWRVVNQEYLLDTSTHHQKPSLPTRTLGGGSSSQASSSKQAPSSPTSSTASNWKQDLLAKQDCVPPNAVQKAYAHPAWIPLVRDWGGNNLAVDLAPGPAGHWGQIILFGRDFDTKYVVARSWSHLLSIVADDLNSGKWWVDEETHELKLREFKQARVEPSYFDILRWRTDQKYGARRAPRRKPGPSNGTASPTGSMSPYMSPSDPTIEMRGRSMQRLSANSPVASPTGTRPGGYSKSSPLARVTEEVPSPLAESTNNANGLKPAGNLVELETPRHSGEENKAPRLAALENGDAAAAGISSPTSEKARSPKANGKLPAVLEDGLKTIEI